MESQGRGRDLVGSLMSSRGRGAGRLYVASFFCIDLRFCLVANPARHFLLLHLFRISCIGMEAEDERSWRISWNDCGVNMISEQR